MSDNHPEDFCECCKQPNAVWFAPSEIWNVACRDSSILCPVCFIKKSEAAGIKPTSWRVAPEDYSGFEPEVIPPVASNALMPAEACPAPPPPVGRLADSQCDEIIAALETYEWTGFTRDDIRLIAGTINTYSTATKRSDAT